MSDRQPTVCATLLPAQHIGTAEQFIAEGAYVYITGRREAELAAAVEKLGPNARAVKGDVSNLADLDNLYSIIKQEKGRLDIVFANAGGGEFQALGEITEEKLRIMRDADEVFISELRRRGLYEKIWQAFCVLLPVRTVGVQGDARSYDHVLALRAVTSSDGMTADWYPFEIPFLREVSNLITNKVKGVNRVVYDVTSKPPGTIEWE